MKKMMFFLVLPLVFSCSNEDVAYNNQQNASVVRAKSTKGTIESEFKSFYYSSEYDALEKQVEEFEKKMNYNGSSSIFWNGKDVLEWVKKNLSRTSFLSYDQAEADWFSIDSLANGLITKNKSFFILAERNTIEDIKGAINPIFDQEIGGGNGNTTLDKCKEDFKSCRSEALEIFDSTATPPWQPEVPKFVTRIGQGVLFAKAMIKCRGAYNDCKGSIW